MPGNQDSTYELEEGNLYVDVVNASKSNNEMTDYNHTKDQSPNIEELILTPPPEQNYQYLFNEAKYAENGSINLVSNKKNASFEAARANEDLEEIGKEVKIDNGILFI